MNKIVHNALKALLYEAVVNPKPGLVDPVSSGPHPDMTIFTFVDSSLALIPYFTRLYQVGQDFSGEDMTELFEEARVLGQQAEKEMFAATKGVNTHKGAIFSLGILVVASSYAEKTGQLRTDRVLSLAKMMLSGLTKKDFEKLETLSADTAGQKQFVSYGLTGIRGEAEAGFPTVLDRALPFLRQSTGTLQVRLLDTLLLIAAQLKDTNLIKRAGSPEILNEVKNRSAHYFQLGGAKTLEGQGYLATLNQEFARRRLSLGGSADILILTIYFALLEGIF